MKLRLIEAPHKRDICETTMRYDLVLDGMFVGEMWYNTQGYVVNTKLPGFVNSAEQSLTTWRNEIRQWNKRNSLLNRILQTIN